MHGLSRLALAGLLALAACSAPVGVNRLGTRDQHRQLAANALTAGAPSDNAQLILRRHHLEATYADQPELALTTLRAVTLADGANGDELFALAELSYLHAEETGSREHAMAAAVYAYAFLFPDDPTQRPQAVDARYRWAADIYAAGLSRALRAPDGRTMAVAAGTYPLPFGAVMLSFDPSDMQWSGRTLTDFVPTAEYELIGLNNRYRQPGIGVPLAGKPVLSDGIEPGDDLVAEEIRVPVTAVMLLPDARRQVTGEALQGRLDVFTVDSHEEIDIAGQAVPLEIDRSATLAVSLAEVGFWRQELSSFLGDAIGTRKSARLTARQPYRPGRIPVVLVHGTNSSPGRWADMVNDLENDARIRARYQFWFFSYDSGNPIAYSAMLLRRALSDAVARFERQAHDACLQRMVVVGHSQGGLLAKMTVVETGHRFVDNISSTPFEELQLTATTRALLTEALIIEPLPFVQRVIFISTPHQGSYLAGPALVRRLAARLISLPRDVVTVSTEVLRDPASRGLKMQTLPTAIDNMSPNHPFIRTLAAIPVADGVPAHSIIPVLGDGPLAEEADGVVAYPSAHLAAAESERVIRGAGHSVQGDARAVDEVRRILLAHDGHPLCGPGEPAPSAPPDSATGPASP